MRTSKHIAVYNTTATLARLSSKNPAKSLANLAGSSRYDNYCKIPAWSPFTILRIQKDLAGERGLTPEDRCAHLARGFPRRATRKIVLYCGGGNVCYAANCSMSRGCNAADTGGTNQKCQQIGGSRGW